MIEFELGLAFRLWFRLRCMLRFGGEGLGSEGRG